MFHVIILECLKMFGSNFMLLKTFFYSLGLSVLSILLVLMSCVLSVAVISLMFHWFPLISSHILKGVFQEYHFIDKIILIWSPLQINSLIR